jgi:hypothetical protein
MTVHCRDTFGLGDAGAMHSAFPRYSVPAVGGDYTLAIRGLTMVDDAKFQCQVPLARRVSGQVGAADGAGAIQSQVATVVVQVASFAATIRCPGPARGPRHHQRAATGADRGQRGGGGRVG